MISSIIVLAAFAVNLVLLRILASPSDIPFSNFSYTLYGLASGGNSWHYVLERYPELLDLPGSAQSKIIYQMAFDLIQKNPGLLINGALYNWSMLFSDSWYSAYSFVGGENRIVRNIAQSTLFGLWGLGLLRWFRKPEDPLTSLMGVSVLGVLISVPFLPPTDAYRMRPYAANMIIFGLLPALGLLFVMETLRLTSASKPNYEYAQPGMLVVFTTLLVSATLLGPLVVKNIGNPPHFEQVTCVPGLDLISIHFDRSASFNILRQNQPGLDWMPDFHIGRFRPNAHSLPDSNMIEWAENIDPLTTVFYALDYRSSEKVLVVAPTKLLPSPDSLWSVSGEWEEKETLKIYHIFYVREAAS